MPVATPMDDALDDLRISGAILLYESYTPPWAIDVPPEARLRELLSLSSDTRVLPFHLVRRNGFDLAMTGHDVVSVRVPEVLICPSGLAHRMFAGRGSEPVAFEAILVGHGPPPAAASDTTATELVCGVFMTRGMPLNPLLAALPPFLTVSTGDPSLSSVLSGAADLLAAELQRGRRGGFTASRLLEVFCAEAIRAFQRRGDAGTGWFRGLADPKIAAAIGAVHARPAADWSVERLAEGIALSPSRFAARFREATGQSVMEYVGRWRANLACRLLRDSDLGLAEIGYSVGYGSLPAFSRAFRHQIGTPPGRWRTLARAA